MRGCRAGVVGGRNDATIGTSSDDAQWGLEDVTEVFEGSFVTRPTNTR